MASLWLTSTVELNVGSAGVFLPVPLERGTLQLLVLLTRVGMTRGVVCFFLLVALSFC